MDENEKSAAAFNLWMDEFVNHPEQFRNTTELALTHMREKLDGRPPTYGENCAVTYGEYLKRVNAEAA